MNALDTTQVMAWCADVVGLAQESETADAHASLTARRAARLSDPSMTALGRAVGGLVRLHRNRDVYLAIDNHDQEQTAAAMTYARLMRSSGPALPQRPALFTDTGWETSLFTEEALFGLESRRDVFAALETKLREAISRMGDDEVLLGDAAVVEQHTVEAFAASNSEAIAFARTNLELRIFADLHVGGTRSRTVASTYANRMGDLNVEALVREACLAVRARVAPARPFEIGRLTLSPSTAARLLHVVVRDLVTTTGGRSIGEMPVTVVDDGRAPGGQASGRFDQEGAATGVVDLIDRSGNVAPLASRNIARSREPQDDGTRGGHATRHPYQTTPEPWPRNVRVEAATTWDASSIDGAYAYATRGEGTAHMRNGQEITLRLDTARLAGGQPECRTGAVVIRASAADLLRSIIQVSPVVSYQPGREFCAGASWLQLDLSLLPHVESIDQ